MGWNYLSIPKLQRSNHWSLGMGKQFHPTLYCACDYLSMLGLKLNHISKRGHRTIPLVAGEWLPTCQWSHLNGQHAAHKSTKINWWSNKPCVYFWNISKAFSVFFAFWLWLNLTHWGRVTHICVGNLTIISPDNGLSPGRRQAIIWTNAGILLIGHWGTKFNEILIGIRAFSFKKTHLKMSSAKWRPFCLGLNVLKEILTICRVWFW